MIKLVECNQIVITNIKKQVTQTSLSNVYISTQPLKVLQT